MAYLGTTPANQNDLLRTAAIPRDAERFSGNGSTTNFTLSRTLYGATDASVVVENVYQEPIVSYNIVGNQLVFTEAPPSGTNNIYVVYRAVQGAQVTLPDGSVSYNKLANNIRLFTVDNYIANSSISTYALSEAPADANTLAVSIDGIVQRAPINYTTTANTITFTSAPPTGANVHIKHLGFRSSSVVTAIPAGTTITQPVLSNPTITLAAEGSSFKGNVALFDSTGSNRVGQFGATGSGQFQLDAGANTVSVRASTIALANVTSFSVANTAGATGLTIDAAGRPLTPTRPSFHAYLGPGATVTGSAWTELNSTTLGTSYSIGHNQNGHFNASTGRFTAPVAGKYIFNAAIRAGDGTGQEKVAAIQMWINGSNVYGTDFWSGYAPSYGGAYRPSISLSIVLSLSVNDYVSIAQFASSTPSLYNVQFSGFLVG
jgi:hypothetical protein